ncbi:MAG: FkbM family methyltransferase [Sphingobium sp.]|nr:FkbM family methyltransferase [Sphingobium sp.]
MNSERIKREVKRRGLGLRLALAGRIHQFPEIWALHRFFDAFAIDALIDVGANQGQYALTARKDCGFTGHIFSFEPNPDIFAIVAREAAKDPKWHVHNIALSDFDGESEFHIMAAHQFSSLKKPSDHLDPIFADRNKVERTVQMQCRRLDGMIKDLLGQYGLSRPFLKMDTQGHDRAVCEGAGDALSLMLGVQTELAVRPQYEGATEYRAMIGWLEERGFIPNAFFANNKGHFPALVEMDGIFLRADLAGEGAISA